MCGPWGRTAHGEAMKRRALAATLLLGALAIVAASADLIASDLPLLAAVDGHKYVLPCLLHPAALADDDQQTLRARGAFILPTPIPYGPLAQHPGGVTAVLEPPSGAHWLGTDDRGRDVAARLVHGTRVAAVVGPIAVALYVLLGVVVGVAAAQRRAADLVLGRVVEIGLTFPTLFLLLCVQGLTGSTSLAEVALAIALTQWPHVARLCRAEALKAAASPHVEAARALGASSLRIAWKHIAPEAIAPALVAGAFGVAQAVLFETALTFLGLGVPPPRASWGELLAQAQASGLKWWLLAPPTLAVAATVIGCNLAADSLRARVSPRGQP